MNKAIDVARYILTLLDEDTAGDLMSHLKLQKLLYYCQGFTLALLNRPLFEDKVVAWQHGPVVPTVWEEFKHYGSQPIPKPYGFDRSVIPDDAREVINEVPLSPSPLSAPCQNLIGHRFAPRTTEPY